MVRAYAKDIKEQCTRITLHRRIVVCRFCGKPEQRDYQYMEAGDSTHTFAVALKEEGWKVYDDPKAPGPKLICPTCAQKEENQ